MAERVVSIKLIADASGVVRGFAAARDAASETGKKIADSARNNREEWATVGKGLTAVGVAITGIGLAAVKTGIEYNTLQQTTRAALTSLLGSAKAANAQMDALDAFARNSPFAKQTFIQAQQQMLAFGIETKKVIPYLDAVQNAVAAAGGSNADIAGIVATMSKIQSSAKITATDLMEFGNRGVNAADLIGSQMGKTGAQIRTDITAGSLSAGKALDALAAGMSEKYAGAAANVKNTFAGAMDRVKAAWRDFSAELAKPLVDPNGGGALVDFLNWTADMMRAFEALPGPVKNSMAGVVGLTGAVALFGGTAILVVPQVAAFKKALADLDLVGSRAAGALGRVARASVALGAVAAINTGIEMLADQLAQKVTPAAEDVTNKVRTAKNAVEAFQGAISKDSVGPVSVERANMELSKMGSTLDNVAKHQESFWNSLDPGMQQYRNTWATFAKEIASMAATDLPAASLQFREVAAAANLTDTQMIAGINTSDELKKALTEQATAAGLAADDSTLLALVLGKVGPAAKEGASGAQEQTDALDEMEIAAQKAQKEIEKLANEIRGFGSVQLDSREANRKMEDSLLALSEALTENGTNFDITTAAGRQNEAALDAVAEATNNAAAGLTLAGASQEEVNAKLAEGRSKLVDILTPYYGSRDAAAAYVDQLNLISPEKTTLVLLSGVKQALEDLKTFQGRLDSIPKVVRAELQVTQALTMRDPAAEYRANGGTIGGAGYAQGGTILKAATGMTIPGIGGGVVDGTVWGRGTSKSDSVRVALSRGEEVIQEPYASLNRGLLKAINRGQVVNGMTQPQVIVTGGGTTSIEQNVAITQVDRDPRLVARQLGRELKEAMA